MDTGEILMESDKNSREVLRVSLREYSGHRFADVRSWYRTTTGAELKPGKGATVKPELLPDVIAALQAAQARFEAEASQ